MDEKKADVIIIVSILIVFTIVYVVYQFIKN